MRTAALAAVAAVAATAALVTGCSGAGVIVSQQALSRALVVAGGREIVVPVTAGGCVQRSRLTATGTASQVTLVLDQYSQGAVCAADVSYGTATVTMRHPLGRRSLVDGTTGRRVPYFDGTKLPPVTYLPPGYRFSRYFPAGRARAGWERDYISSARGNGPIIVAQAPGKSPVGPAWSPEPAVRAGGRLLSVRQGASGAKVFGREVCWRAGGYSFAVYTLVAREGQQPVPLDELSRIAAGLSP
jgi:hypothetical protein